MVDEDEEWGAPEPPALPPLTERVETLEAGDEPTGETQPGASLEDRITRLERIAEYLHDVRREAATLGVGVDKLAEATTALTTVLVVIERQQQKIDALDERVTTTEVGAEAFHERAMQRAYAFATIITVAVLILGGGLYAYERDRRADSVERCQRRNAQAEINILTAVTAVIPPGADDPKSLAILNGLRRYEALVVDCTPDDTDSEED